MADSTTRLRWVERIAVVLMIGAIALMIHLMDSQALPRMWSVIVTAYERITQ